MLDHVSFSTVNYLVYEDEGPVDVTLQLHKPAFERITVRVTATSISATGKFCTIYADTHYHLVRTLSNAYNLLHFINVKFGTFNLVMIDINLALSFIS